MNEVRKVEESKAKEIRIKEMVSDIYAKYMKGLSVKAELEELMQFMDLGDDNVG